MQKSRRQNHLRLKPAIEQLEGIRLLSSILSHHPVHSMLEQPGLVTAVAGPVSAAASQAMTGMTEGHSITIRSSSYKGFSWGWCTWYAATEFDKSAPSPGVNWHGNAGDWLANADRAGWVTKRSPRDATVGAIIVWQNGGAGHVAIVHQVTSTSIRIEEMNWPVFGQVTSRTLLFSNLNRGSYTFAGYILPRRK